MTALSEPIRRFAALGLAAAVLLAFVGLFVQPLVTRLAANSEAIERGREHLGSLAAVARSEGKPGPEQLQRSRRQLSEAFIAGESEAVQLGTIQAMLQSIASEVGLRFLSLRTTPVPARHGIALIGAQATLSAPLADVQKLLVRLESHRPLILIDGLEMAVTTGGATRQSTGEQVIVTLRLLGPTGPSGKAAP